MRCDLERLIKKLGPRAFGHHTKNDTLGHVYLISNIIFFGPLGGAKNLSWGTLAPKLSVLGNILKELKYLHCSVGIFFLIKSLTGN